MNACNHLLSLLISLSLCTLAKSKVFLPIDYHSRSRFSRRAHSPFKLCTALTTTYYIIVLRRRTLSEIDSHKTNTAPQVWLWPNTQTALYSGNCPCRAAAKLLTHYHREKLPNAIIGSPSLRLSRTTARRGQRVYIISDNRITARHQPPPNGARCSRARS